MLHNYSPVIQQLEKKYAFFKNTYLNLEDRIGSNRIESNNDNRFKILRIGIESILEIWIETQHYKR
jgi:hypothetical protein